MDKFKALLESDKSAEEIANTMTEATVKPMKKAKDLVDVVDDLFTELYDNYPDFPKAQKEIKLAIAGIESSIKQIKKDLQ